MGIGFYNKLFCVRIAAMHIKVSYRGGR